ncbi:GNAT family N-acetyltransferase [Caballeronia sordidicola]|uniref:GNAT family N-acetyltransferase n=1 Tax=Caballeronia sordidicola TaxID=196367 RepID=UPI0004D02DD7|nr:GNAT family N-acetyltransferase [Caballeronia sordidicola]
MTFQSALHVRGLNGDEALLAAMKVFRTAMIGLPMLPRDQAVELNRLNDAGRTYGAFEDDRLIGTTDSYAGTIAVPGGERVPHAAVTHVGVLPGHTRRGVAKALLVRQLEDAAKRGEALASLRAASASIYGRFGYAVASSAATIEVDAVNARMHVDVARGSVQLIDTDDAWRRMPVLYRSLLPERAGAIDRGAYWWRLQELRQQGALTPSHVAVHGEEGYVRYHAVPSANWFAERQRTIVVDDLVAASPETYAALIAHVLSLDLVHRIVLTARPTDDLLPWLLEDYRHAKATDLRDETWLRIVDTRIALNARRYSDDASVVIDVTDPLLAQNNGRFQITSNGVVPSDATPDVTADVAALAAAYLGGTRWWQLVQSGRAQARSASAVTALDQLFSTDAAPFCGTHF